MHFSLALGLRLESLEIFEVVEHRQHHLSTDRRHHELRHNFEIGALLALKDEWQKVDQLRILMGNEVSPRTKDAFLDSLKQAKQHLDGSIEREKEKNDFLVGVPAIVEGIRSGKIACRLYRKDKFHAKAFITHARLEVLNHTDLLRGGEFPERLKRVKEMADAVVIDEAHHFRNPGVRGEEGERRSHYWQMYDVVGGKSLFLLTATPVNNRLLDLQHMIELFSRREPGYFKDAPLGIHSLAGHFRKMEKELEDLVYQQSAVAAGNGMETNEVEAEKVLSNDDLFRALVLQRSRAYVKKSQQQYGGTHAIFPVRQHPKVQPYSVKKTYGSLLAMVEKAYNKEKPLFSLAVYYPLAYYKGPDTSIDPLREGRQKEVVSLIRIQFLKRFESSAEAFEMSCETLLQELLAWVIKNKPEGEELRRYERWKVKHGELMEYVHHRQQELWGDESEEEQDEDIVPAELIEESEELPRDEYKVNEIVSETIDDLYQLAEFLNELKKFKPASDDKLKALVRLLKSDAVLKKHKVLIFSEYMATARYLAKQLKRAGIDGVDEVDSASKRDRGEIIRQFLPYYNGSSSAELQADGLEEARILVSTDVLSEGLNLQDATRLINYDLHWNPVRLMQRIGRVDRRLDQRVEAAILAGHPEQKEIRRTMCLLELPAARRARPTAQALCPRCS